MQTFRFQVDLGNFSGDPSEINSINQSFHIELIAESLKEATKIIESRFGNYELCRHKVVDIL